MNHKENKRVGKRISRIREMRKIKQRDLAYSLGFSETHYCNLERGKVNITVVHLSNLSKLLRVPIEEFLTEILDKTKM